MVCLYAQGRFRQYKSAVHTGAIMILGTEFSYPIRVNVRPNAVQSTAPGGVGGFKNFGPMDAAPPPRDFSGGTITDFVIKDADDRYYPDSPRYLRARNMARALIRVEQIEAPPSPETDIYERHWCESGCGRLVESGQRHCRTCVPGDPLCTAPVASPAGLAECPNPRYGTFAVCYKHAGEQGLLVAAAAPTAPVQRRAKAASAPVAKRKRAPHRDGCLCVACKHRRASQERQSAVSG